MPIEAGFMIIWTAAIAEIRLHHTIWIVRAHGKEGQITMFVQEPDSTRSIARKLAREILPEEMDTVAAAGGTVTLDCNGSDCQPGDIDQGAIA
jgi:hypothetical protein